jgi:excisionase family DNA binding protein
MRTVMTLEEVAAYLRVHQSTVYRLLKAQSIPAFKLGSDWRFNQESIDKWIAEGEQEHAASRPRQGRRPQSSESPAARRNQARL